MTVCLSYFFVCQRYYYYYKQPNSKSFFSVGKYILYPPNENLPSVDQSPR